MEDEVKRRSKLDIMLAVLSAVRDGEYKPTKIMYAANMSWNLTQRIFNELVEQELLDYLEIPRKRRSTKIYSLTEKGINVLNYFEGAKELLNI